MASGSRLDKDSVVSQKVDIFQSLSFAALSQSRRCWTHFLSQYRLFQTGAGKCQNFVMLPSDYALCSFPNLETEVGLDEAIEVSVEDGIGISHLVASAQVLHHTIGMQNVGADLIPPPCLHMFTLQSG